MFFGPFSPHTVRCCCTSVLQKRVQITHFHEQYTTASMVNHRRMHFMYAVKPMQLHLVYMFACQWQLQVVCRW